LNEPAIETRGLGKAFRRWRSPARRALEALSLGRLRGHERFWALKDLDLSLPRGSALGVVGANGAGKTTLLRVLSGATAPTAGRYRLGPGATALLELGTGFQRDFTGRENIALSGLLLGYGRRELARLAGEIIDFSELGEFIDEPVRTWSAGMAMRLGFAIAFASRPRLLMVDEVIAVGDLYFQKKCVDRLLELRREGGTLLLSSHSLYDVRQLCDRALWLRGGRAERIGESAEVTAAYASAHLDRRAEGPLAAAGGAADLPRLLDLRVRRPGGGTEAWEVHTGEGIEVAARWTNPAPAEHPVHLGICFERNDRTLLAAAGTQHDGVRLEGAGGTCVLRVPRLDLLSGSFTLRAILFDAEGVHRYCELASPRDLVVASRSREVGLVRLDHTWEVQADEPMPREACA